MKKILIIFFIIITSFFISCGNEIINDNSKNKMENKIAKFETEIGDFEVELYTKLMPITAGNFVDLIEKEFYDNQRFHRIVDNFIIQAGDPNSKDLNKKNLWGTGGPGYKIQDEFIKNENLSNLKYTLSMANSGPNSGGSQFFINLVDNKFLDFDIEPSQSKHPVFGKVISGFDVIEKIGKSQGDEILIKKVYIK